MVSVVVFFAHARNQNTNVNVPLSTQPPDTSTDTPTRRISGDSENPRHYPTSGGPHSSGGCDEGRTGPRPSGLRVGRGIAGVARSTVKVGGRVLPRWSGWDARSREPLVAVVDPATTPPHPCVTDPGKTSRYPFQGPTHTTATRTSNTPKRPHTIGLRTRAKPQPYLCFLRRNLRGLCPREAE
jgi:hypothetical protein